MILTDSNATIFFSYASADKDAAAYLAKRLIEFGLNIWCDIIPASIKPGETWISALERALQESKSYLILIGNRGVDKWVRFEADYALNRYAQQPEYRIIPILLPGTAPESLPPFLNRFQVIRLPENFLKANSAWFADLVEQISSSYKIIQDQDCPFPGLEAFDESQTRYFFGRDSEILQMCECLSHRRWLQIEGTSGAGKSSIARAGLVSAFHRQWILHATPYWIVAVMRPLKDPVFELAKAIVQGFGAEGIVAEIDKVHNLLAANKSEDGFRYLLAQYPLPPQHGLLLIVDQFEEAFTAAEISKVKQFDALLNSALTNNLPFYLITTIRSDSIDRFKDLPNLSSSMNRLAHRYYLKPMAENALREAVVAPVKLADLRWEDGLAQQIVNDTVAEQGSLPLLGFVLRKLFKYRQLNTLTWNSYQSLRGVGGALSTAAEDLWGSLTEEQQKRGRALLLALVNPGRGSRDTRRTLTRTEALEAAGGGAAAEEVLRCLSGVPSAIFQTPGHRSD